ncbi:MAG: hypothetical protein LBU66_04760 [Treponema sp.]|nr:hypothetical protein [Treponema sp.]
MKKQVIIFLIIFCTICSFLTAQEAQDNNTRFPIIQQLYRFSPMGEIVIRNLGMEDKNGNGVIDKGAGEGYEEFIERYGIGETFEEKEQNIDRGFHANNVIIGAANGKLEENEIVNHYYIYIRFNPAFLTETETIENEIKSFVYTNNIPLVWLDDEQGTVMNVVNGILGEGWNEQETEITEDEAIRMFTRIIQGMRVTGRLGVPSINGGYHALPEFVNRRAGYCFEAAQFAFWFFSELRINSIAVQAAHTNTILHQEVRLNSGKRIDYFDSSRRYNVPENNWHIQTPFECIGTHYRVKSETLANRTLLEYAALYDKYSINSIGGLMNFYFNRAARSYADVIIDLGEFFLQNNDIDKILNARHNASAFVRGQVKPFLLMMLVCNSISGNRTGYDKTAALLRKHYPRDTEVNKYLNDYR